MKEIYFKVILYYQHFGAAFCLLVCELFCSVYFVAFLDELWIRKAVWFSWANYLEEWLTRVEILFEP